MFTKENVINARYSNNKDLVLVEWVDEKDVRRIYNLFEDNNDPAWKSLKEAGWTKKKIDEASETYKVEFSKNFEDLARNIFRKNDEAEYRNLLEDLFNDDVDDGRDTQHLFTLKLFLFELSEVKRSNNREAKVALRKAKSSREALFIAVDIVKETPPIEVEESQDSA